MAQFVHKCTGSSRRRPRIPPRTAALARIGAAPVVLAAFLSACSSAPYHLFERPVNFGGAEVSPILRYESGVSAAAAPDESDGQVLYRIFRPGPGAAPAGEPVVRSCYLQHGYGALPVIQNIARGDEGFTSLVESYWSRRLVEALLAQTCAEVVIAVQETAESSILEMTLRTEAFLRDVVCPPERSLRYRAPAGPIKNCAFVGHSKGGAVAFNMARRCMQKRSTLGPEGCAWLDELFSAAGVLQGSALVFSGYGLDLSMDRAPEDPFAENPVWLDVGPMAPLEDGVPIAVQNTVALERRGWLRGEFAAFATDYRFPQTGGGELYGCGVSEVESAAYLRGCRAFGAALGEVYHPRFQPYFQRGLEAARNDPRFHGPDGTARYLDDINWPRVRRSDGLVDFESALGVCRLGLGVTPGKRVVQSCTALDNANHWANAGGNPDARLDILLQLSN